MIKKIMSLSFFSAMALIAVAQGSLVFSQAKIVSNSEETVPQNKVWKVTAVYGVDAVCLINATLYTTATAPAYQNYYVGYAGAGIIVNGVNIPTQRIWNSPTSYPTTLYTYPDNTCNNSNNYVTRQNTSFDVAPNPNVLPQWLPAGTTLKTPTNKVFASVIEFDVQ